jgi:UDP-glucuronate 4-epimerase
MAGTALVTGSAGFIGYHLCQRLLADGWTVVGLDALTDYYDVRLKERRQAMLLQSPGFRAVTERIETPGVLQDLMADLKPDAVIHLAAQAGVRYSIDAPESYVEANLVGTFRLLEAIRAPPPRHLLASTSSVYGANTEMPYAETAEGRHADVVLRGHQEGHRGDGPFLCPSLRPAGDDVPLLHGLRALGPAGHGAVQVHQGDPRRAADRRLQPRRHERDFTYVDDLVDGIRG